MARILIAEHTGATAQYLAQALRKAGNSLEIADNCLDAWRASSNDFFDVLLINVAMPGIDAFVLAQRALQENPDAQIIFVSGFSGTAMDTQATPPYAPAPITSHPFHLREIASRVRYLMGFGSMPGSTQQEHSGNIVYADFAQKPAGTQGPY